MNKKLVIGIDINEIFRSKWLQYDSFFIQEFGLEGIPADPYTYDLFNNYPWKEVTEVINVLKDVTPDDINPGDYQLDENGESKADILLFNKEKIHLTAKEAYNKFMFEDFLFEIFAKSPQIYRGLDLHAQQFYKKYSDHAEFVISSIENWYSRPMTLMFLSTMLCRFTNIRFVDNAKEMWNGVDILITTDPEILFNEIPEGKKTIKVSRPYNDSCNGSIEILQFADLLTNKDFQNMINFEELPDEEKE